jgi:hypothetical protein
LIVAEQVFTIGHGARPLDELGELTDQEASAGASRLMQRTKRAFREETL